MNSNKKIIVGITGGIASGKSLVADDLIQKGVRVINADKIGHELLHNETIKKQIITCFGDVVAVHDEIDRKQLGRIVFHSKDALHKLNAIVHPHLVKEILRRIDASSEKYIAIDAALLFQWNMDKICDHVLLVTASKDVRVERLMRNTNLSQGEAEDRINSQHEFSEENADYVLHNNGSLEHLHAQLNSIWRQITHS